MGGCASDSNEHSALLLVCCTSITGTIPYLWFLPLYHCGLCFASYVVCGRALISDRGRIARHIVPLLGRKSVASVTRDDVEAFMHDIATGKTASRQKTKPRGLSVVRGGRGVASRSVGLLGAIFTYAIRKGLRFDNPAHGIVRFADGRRQRRLTDDEYRQLGRALKHSGSLEAGHCRHMADDPDRMATR